MIYAYFGPETTLPLASVLVGVVGFFLTVGRVAFSGLAQKVRPRAEKTKNYRLR